VGGAIARTSNNGQGSGAWGYRASTRASFSRARYGQPSGVVDRVCDSGLGGTKPVRLDNAYALLKPGAWSSAARAKAGGTSAPHLHHNRRPKPGTHGHSRSRRTGLWPAETRRRAARRGRGMFLDAEGVRGSNPLPPTTLSQVDGAAGEAARMQHSGVRVGQGMPGQRRAAANWSWWSIHQRRRRS
jgi:hypothetical protein